MQESNGDRTLERHTMEHRRRPHSSVKGYLPVWGQCHFRQECLGCGVIHSLIEWHYSNPDRALERRTMEYRSQSHLNPSGSVFDAATGIPGSKLVWAVGSISPPSGEVNTLTAYHC